MNRLINVSFIVFECFKTSDFFYRMKHCCLKILQSCQQFHTQHPQALVSAIKFTRLSDCDVQLHVNYGVYNRCLWNTHENFKRKQQYHTGYFGKTQLYADFITRLVLRYNKRKNTKCNEKCTSMNLYKHSQQVRCISFVFTPVIASLTPRQ